MITLSRMRRRALAPAVILALALAWPGLATIASASEKPRAVAEMLDAALIETMRNAKELGYDGRFKSLAPILNKTFDYAFMARVSVGRHWRKMSEAEQARMVEMFSKLSVATFAARFDGYSGETFEVTGEEPQPRGAILVLNQLNKSNGEPVSLNYLMREAETGWRIVDVFLDAKYSELAIKRSEYTSVIEREGFDGLIEEMEKKIDDLAESAKG